MYIKTVNQFVSFTILVKVNLNIKKALTLVYTNLMVEKAAM